MRHRKTACFQALVLHPHFAQMLRPLLATLLLGRQKFAACIIYLNDANCESPGFFQHLPAAHDLERRMIFFPLSMQSPNKHCIETVEPFARADRPNSLVFLSSFESVDHIGRGPPESRSKDADVPRAPFKQCCEAAAGFNIAELMWTCCLPTHLNIAKLGSKGSTRQKPKTSAKEKDTTTT